MPGRFLWTAVLLLPMTAYAQGGRDPLEGSAALGYLATSGNTDSTNANANFDLRYTPGEIWHYIFTAAAVGASRDGLTTSEAYWAGAKAQRDYSETDYLFGSVDWKKDRFSGYSDQISEAIGYGRRLMNTERHVLNLEGGAGARQSTLSTGVDQKETIVRAGIEYVLSLSETSNFTQRALVEVGDENTFSESVSRLSTRVMNDIALVLSYTIRNNTDVPVDRERRDTFTSIALEYAF